MSAEDELLLAKIALIDIFRHVRPDEENLRPETEDIVRKMLNQNPTLEPDTLVRAAFFVAKSHHEKVTIEDVRRIKQNGGRANFFWPALVPSIRIMLQEKEEQ